jgi:hypothetical protein
MFIRLLELAGMHGCLYESCMYMTHNSTKSRMGETRDLMFSVSAKGHVGGG